MSANPSIQRRRLGLILRQLRLDAGLTCEQVGEALERTGSWVSRIEGGHHKLRVRDLNGILDTLKFDETEVRRQELVELASGGKGKGWWNKYGSGLAGQYATYIGFEDAATALHTYALQIVPGLLQTEEYARALIEHGTSVISDDTAERRVQIRLTRQKRLTAEGNPLQVCAILDEAVLKRAYGGPAVLKGQLEHLISLHKQLSNVTIQVLPLGQPINPGMVCAFGVLEFEGCDPEIVFSEGLTGMLFEEEVDAKRYISVFGDLRSAALTPPQSANLIKKALGDIA